MFRGNFSAKIDDKGRLKIPASFRLPIAEQDGGRVFVTSINGESALIYPLPVWEDLEGRANQLPRSHRSLNRFFDRGNYFGQEARIDAQGRVSVHMQLRTLADLAGEVYVLGMRSHLEVWNKERKDRHIEDNPYTAEDADALAELGF